MSEITNIFHRDRLDTSYFELEDVYNDNACFYRAVSNGIRYFHDQDPTKTYNDNFKEQTSLVKELQMIIIQWLRNNPNYIIPYHNDMELDVKTLINVVHNISYHEYIELYSYFAGTYIQDLPHRWGSFCEQSIISEIFKIPIVVMTLEKLDKNNNIISGRIWQGKKPYKNTKYKILQISGKQYIDKLNKDPIFLLWRKNKEGEEHYMALYPNCSVKQKILDIINS